MLANVLDCAREALERAGATASNVIAMGISNQTETLVVWDRETGRPAMPAMVWQCRRGNDEIAHLRVPEVLKLILERTGVDLDPTFTAAKLRYLFAHRPHIADGLRSGRLLWGTVDTWLRWKLTGGRSYATEPGNASRTMLFDISRRRWDDRLSTLFGLPRLAMPELRPSAGGTDLTEPGLLGAPIPVTASLGDQQASLFGHGCFAAGDTKVTYGTGAFAWMNKGAAPPAEAPEGIVRTIAWSLDETAYAFEGFVMTAGTALDWVADRMGLASGATAAKLAAEAGNSNGVILVPAFQGLGSPWWQPEAKAMLAGLTPASTQGNIAHSALEAIAFQIRLLLDDMGPTASLSVDGGLTRSPYFLALQANVLEKPLSRASIDATSPYGAALMAGIGAGAWKNPAELRPLIRHEAAIQPRLQPGLTGIATWRAWVDAAIAMSRAAL
jgi:glycerol kinase